MIICAGEVFMLSLAVGIFGCLRFGWMIYKIPILTAEDIRNRNPDTPTPLYFPVLSFMCWGLFLICPIGWGLADRAWGDRPPNFWLGFPYDPEWLFVIYGLALALSFIAAYHYGQYRGEKSERWQKLERISWYEQEIQRKNEVITRLKEKNKSAA